MLVQFTIAFRVMDGVGAEMDLFGGMFVGKTNDLVRDLLNSVLDEVVGKCEEERGKLGARRMPFSDEQRLVLQQAYSENSYTSGGNLNTLAARLGVDYRRIRGWFGQRRQMEN